MIFCKLLMQLLHFNLKTAPRYRDRRWHLPHFLHEYRSKVPSWPGGFGAYGSSIFSDFWLYLQKWRLMSFWRKIIHHHSMWWLALTTPISLWEGIFQWFEGISSSTG